jgi:glycosyltransferase involved in cell wall biosynthesis
MSAPPIDHSIRISLVVPVLNAIRFLPKTIPSFMTAARHSQGVEIICVDNGSTDGSFEYLANLVTEGIRLERRERVAISAVRNFGASLGKGDFLSFIDADCLIRPNYFDEAIQTLSSTGAAATGYEVETPADPHWIESTWGALHYSGHSGEVRYLNSGNFFLRHEAFDEVGGFREDLQTGEDSEIGQRLLRAGYRIYSSPSVGATHLGNPRTLREFYRRNVWHGLGMFATVSRHRLDRPALMMILHLVATGLGLIAFIAGPFNLPVRVLIVSALQLMVPVITVIYRSFETGRVSRFSPAVFLYWLYYWARLHALLLIATRKEPRYLK